MYRFVHKPYLNVDRIMHGNNRPSYYSSKQTAEGLHRKVHASSTSIYSQRNLSDTSLPKTSEEDEFSVEESNADDLSGILQSSKFVLNPSSVPGNLRKARVRHTSQNLEDFLRRGSFECSKELEGGKIDSLEVAKGKPRRKAYKSPKQKTTEQSCPEDIYSTVQKIHPEKSFNSPLKLRNSIRSDSHLGVDESSIWETPLQGKVRSDLSISLAPYSTKSSVSKNNYISTQSANSSGTKYRNLKKTTNNAKQVQKSNIRKTVQRDDHGIIKNVNTREKFGGMLSDSEDIVTCAQPTTSKPDNLTSNRNASPLRDVKARQSIRQQMPKTDLQTRRERAHTGVNFHERLTAKEIKYELKRKQRREIYALNKVMTQLENERFIQFMQYAGSGT